MTDSTEAKTCSTVLYPSVLCFGWLDWSQSVFDCVRPKRAIIRTARLELVMFRSTGLKQDVFDHVRPKPKRAMFQASQSELVMICQTRWNLKRVWPCSTQAQACYICSESTWTGYVFARLDQKLNVFDRVWPNRAMYRPNRVKQNCFWLCLNEMCCLSIDSTQTGCILPDSFRTKLVLTKFIPSVQCFDRLDLKQKLGLTVFDPNVLCSDRI